MRLKRFVTTALVALATFYLAVTGILYLAQGPLLYPAPRAIGPSTGGFEEVRYATSDDLLLTAGYRAPEPGRPVIVYFHGNGADWVSSVVATDRLVPAGYGVLAAEYRGYRGNPGTPSEEGLYRDGRAALAFLDERGISPGQTIVIGNSIGSGVAVQMALETPPAALVLISPFASLSDLVAEKFRWLPTRLLLRDRYESIDKIAAIDAPVLILHGDADTLIPHHHAERLASAKPDSELRIFAGFGHDLAWHPDAEEAVLDFLARRTGEDPPE
ncbi:alpha/beta hydrolase [Qipengyuania flava]|uniref:alpha/beta hydrolase n=1 Tax=Qipengyuania flava TaxID=192812 RepID=UPI001C639545|nr:alpha/beta hydrolase [Qipengyuania flava]QYJ07399.1 alpha/beta hydrolase [Qipengyuania flava]